jgi:predicted metal-dependent hydrolase
VYLLKSHLQKKKQTNLARTKQNQQNLHFAQQLVFVIQILVERYQCLLGQCIVERTMLRDYRTDPFQVELNVWTGCNQFGDEL